MAEGSVHDAAAPASRLGLALALCAVTPLGFALKLYPGPGRGWPNDYAAGMAYVVFWILVVLWLRPSLPVGRVAVAVFGVTSALEVLQLWNPPPLAAVRSTFLGRTLIGTTFGWWDFPHYAAGALLGVGLVRRLPRDRARPG